MPSGSFQPSPRVSGSTMRPSADDSNGTGVRFRSSQTPLFAGVFGEGPEQVRTAVSGFAGQRLTTRPPGLCQCGCGEPTPLAKKTDRRKGYKKGEPTKYLPGHQTRYENLPYVVDLATGCWVWQAAVNSKGYPVRGDGNGGSYLVHRRQYEDARGPIPPGLDVHHRCHNKRCVNPDHLEALTRREHNAHHREAKRRAREAA